MKQNNTPDYKKNFLGGDGSLFTILIISTLSKDTEEMRLRKLYEKCKMRFADFCGCISLTAGNLITNLFAFCKLFISAYPDPDNMRKMRSNTIYYL